MGSLLGRALPVDRFLPLAIAIARALEELHAGGGFHGALHPRALVLAGGDAVLIEPAAERPPDTLAYFAPEESQRSADAPGSHSDLYSAGAIFYELLSGEPPFRASDPLEWVHCHLAQAPTPLREHCPEVPPILAALVMYLLEKTPEGRYGSALGLRLDLERCWASWREQGAIEPFPLDSLDRPARLALLPRLYGREREIGTLEAVLARVAAEGGRELVTIGGAPGVGKSALVRGLDPAIARHGAILATGKVEEADRESPYSGLASALADVAGRLVDTLAPEDVAALRERVREAVRPNGQLLVDFAPAVERLLGRQPPLPALPISEAPFRFSAAVRRFLAALCAFAPLVLFLDDVQWADPGTIELLGAVLEDESIEHLLVVLAYRERELAFAPLDELRHHARGHSRALLLRPLPAAAVSVLVADVLGREPGELGPLVADLHRRSGGNPFFLVRLLSSLVADGVLRFDHERGRWDWDAERLGADDGADVIDLTEERLRRLPAVTRSLLATAACAGRPLDLPLLAGIAGLAVPEVKLRLVAPAREHLITVHEGRVSFAHDNVRAAAERLVDAPARRRLHHRIAEGLLAATPLDELGERVFAVLEQLEQAGPAALAPHECEQRARLCLLAGRRAKASSAHDAAARYLDDGLALEPEDRDLLLQLRLERAHVAVVRREVELAEELLAGLAPATPDAIAAVASTAMELHMTCGAIPKAVNAGLDAARRLGFEIDAHPGPERALADYEAVRRAVGDRTIAELVDLPPLEEHTARALLRVLTELFIPAYFLDVNLALSIAASGARVSVEHGSDSQSPLAYAALGGQLCGRFARVAEGYEWGKLAIAVAARREDVVVRCQTDLVYATQILHAVRPFREAGDFARDLYADALRIGLLSVATYVAVVPAMFGIAYGATLLDVRRKSEQSLRFLQSVGAPAMVDRVLSTERLIAALRGETEGIGSLAGPGFDLEGLEHRMREVNPPAVGLGYEVMRTRAAIYGGGPLAALEAAERADGLVWAAIGILDGGEAVFACAVAYAMAHDHVERARRPGLRAALDTKLAELRRLAEYGPSYRHRVALVEAEAARLDGDTVLAIERYDQAIQMAAEAGFTGEEALAAECAARYHLGAGRRTLAHACARSARDAYERWEASAKVAALEAEFPALRASGVVAGDLQEQSLDALAIVKTSQAISASMVLSELLDTLLRVTLQHAGADAGSLLLLEDGELRVRAEAAVSAGALRVRVYERGDAPSSAALPSMVLERARRELSPVVVQDARSDEQYAGDRYVVQRQPRSMLCLPLLQQGGLVGLLYVENRLIPQAFTPARLQMLELLGSQAAISLENARLYSEREYMADHDPLTGLYNRRRLDRELERSAAEVRPDHATTLLVLDLDNLKDINDSLGHAAGDELIVSVARLLAERVRETDILARIGGDEFAILLAGTGLGAAGGFAAELCELIGARTTLIGGRRVRATASIGLAPLHNQAEGAGEEALAAADLAMYEAKEEGRNRVATYTAGAGDEARTRLSVVERLRSALETDGLALVRQPILDLKTGDIPIYELLIRLPSDDGDLLPPSSFLPVAERTGLITQLDRWVTARAVTLLAGNAHRNVALAVNLSGRSLADAELPAFVADQLKNAGVDPQRLTFEVTETAAIGNMDRAAALAAELRALGCRFALDDFGAGFGSFYYLKHLPLDAVKLDGDFIRDLPNSPADQLVVRAMVDIAHGLGLRTVAEYVQDTTTTNLLRDYGVDAAQGFHIGRPEPLPPE